MCTNDNLLLFRWNRLQRLPAFAAQSLTEPAQAVAIDYIRDAKSVDLPLGKAVVRIRWNTGIMTKRISTALFLAQFLFAIFLYADEKPYITTKTPLTLPPDRERARNPLAGAGVPCPRGSLRPARRSPLILGQWPLGSDPTVGPPS
jgi:hypothetical protein